MRIIERNTIIYKLMNWKSKNNEMIDISKKIYYSKKLKMKKKFK